MSGDDIGRFLYLALLGAALLSWFFVHNRQSLGRVAQQAVAWVLIFVGVIAVVGLWGDVRQSLRPSLGSISADGAITVPRGPDGHYYLTLLVNDKPVEFLVDTGASDVVLTEGDARRVGLETGNLAYVGRAMTANGEVRTAPVTLESVALGPVHDTRIPASVNEGEMGKSLLGMSYLQRFGSIEISDGSMILRR